MPSATAAAPAIQRGTIEPTRTNGEIVSLDNQKTRWIVASLEQRSGANPDAVQTADATIAVWFDVATALQSIIGRQGVAALYDRSVSLTAKVHPWLIPWRSHDDHSVDLDALQSVIARQTTEDAAAGAGALLQTFYDVLVGLIGPALCEQLLASVRESVQAPPTPKSVQL
jgi:hypothetical protein